MPLKRPLNPDAVAAADAKLAAKTRGRKLTMGPEDKALRQEWLEAYKAAGGESVGGSGPQPPEKIQTGCLPCQKKGKFVGRYVHKDWIGVAGAKYTLKAMGDVVLAEGTLDAEGRFKKDDIPTIHGYAYFEVGKDPTPPQYEIKPDKTPEPAEESASLLDNVVDWSWGVLQGDFKKDPTLSQVVVGALIQMIPYVDQAADIRDIVANIYHLVEYYSNEDKRDADQIKKDKEAFFGLGTEFELWFNLTVTGIGCIPTIGSAAKGVIKVLFKFFPDLARKGLDPHRLKQIFDEIAKALNWFGKFNAKKWLKEVLIPNLKSWIAKAKDYIRKAIDALDSALTSLEAKLKSFAGIVADFFSDRRKQLLELIERWKKVIRDKLRPKMNKKVDEVGDETKKLAEKAAETEIPTTAGKPIDSPDEVVIKQEAKKPEGPSLGQNRANLGKLREQKVAEITGGKVSNQKITSKMGSTDVDVEGPNGELIAVGGPKKAAKLENTKRSLRVMKENAEKRGVNAQAYFTRDTPQNVIDSAKKILGDDNVFLFDDIK